LTKRWLGVGAKKHLEERAKKEDVGKVKKGPGGHQIAGNRNT
jgi:hypothetical protein